jgi:hypothetical protein
VSPSLHLFLPSHQTTPVPGRAAPAGTTTSGLGSAKSASASAESSLIVYAIDTVRGATVARLVLPGARGPAHLALCENFVVVHYYNPAAVQYEVAVLELVDTAPADITYGGALAGMHGSVVSAWNRTRPGSLHQVACSVPAGRCCCFVFVQRWPLFIHTFQSSQHNSLIFLCRIKKIRPRFILINSVSFFDFDCPFPLISIAQTYTFRSAVRGLAVTQSGHGLTNKQLLLALASGQLLGIDRSWLDPRRVLEPTAEEREEGVVPYKVELPFNTLDVLSRARAVAQSRGVASHGAGLESTALVFQVLYIPHGALWSFRGTSSYRSHSICKQPITCNQAFAFHRAYQTTKSGSRVSRRYVTAFSLWTNV